MKKLVIFGNGLGRSIDNDFYQLERALSASWEADNVLNEEQRRLIFNCLDDNLIEGELSAPTSEEQLKDLQRILDACDMIKGFERKDGAPEYGWLSDHGKRFPIAIRKYFHHAASQFHDSQKRLPDDFADDLREFVSKYRPHIATLNYDDLLYECFTETKIFSKHMLRDGFFGSFNIEQHKKFFSPKTEGWFLHLHGSPLFVTKGDDPKKIMRSELSDYVGNNSVHLVLTNAKAKPSVIANSAILSAYWKELSSILSNGADITLFGYSGKDLHLNELLSKGKPGTKIRIVCRKSEKSEAEVVLDWRALLKLPDDFELSVIRKKNLLKFNDWA